MANSPHYSAGADREQAVLFPEVIDDYIAQDNPVRLLDAFVAGLDLVTLGFARAVTATGRPPYDPGDLLRLYVLRVSQPASLLAPPGSRGRAQPGVDPAPAPPAPGLQDDCRLPPR